MIPYAFCGKLRQVHLLKEMCHETSFNVIFSRR